MKNLDKNFTTFLEATSRFFADAQNDIFDFADEVGAFISKAYSHFTIIGFRNRGILKLQQALGYLPHFTLKQCV